MPSDKRFNRFLQRLLNEHGYELAVDGDAGDKTRAALKDFQEQMGLKPDGRATEATLKALRKAETAKAVPTPTPRPSLPGAMAKAAAAYPSREPRPMPPPMEPAVNPGIPGGFGDTEFGARFDPNMEGTLGPDAARPWAVPPPAGFNDGMTFAGPDDPAMQQQLETRAGQATGNSPLAGGDMPPMQMAPQPPAAAPAGPDFSQADPTPPIPDNILMALQRALGGSAQAAEAPPEMAPGQRGIGSDYAASTGKWKAAEEIAKDVIMQNLMRSLMNAAGQPEGVDI